MYQTTHQSPGLGEGQGQKETFHPDLGKCRLLKSVFWLLCRYEATGGKSVRNIMVICDTMWAISGHTYFKQIKKCTVHKYRCNMQICCLGSTVQGYERFTMRFPRIMRGKLNQEKTNHL